MQSRLFINLFLFIVVIGLALFLFNTEESEETTKDVLLSDIDPTSVNTIQISRKQTGNIIFKKENDKWLMQSPYQLSANPVRINTMLGLLRAHSYTRFNKEEVELERFMLDAPEVSIQFNEIKIDFGDTSPLGKQRYVLVNDTVHLINDSLYQQLQTPATFFLKGRLLESGSEITAITFPDYSLKKQEGIWKLEPDTGISGDDIVSLINAWQQLEAISIQEYENGESSGVIKIELDNHAAIEFVIVSQPPQLVLARPELGIQYHISGYDADKLFLSFEQNDETTENTK